MHFPSQNQQNVKYLAVTPPDKKMKKNVNLNMEEVFKKA